MEILHEDNQIIVVKKPQNVPSQADTSGDEDMLSMVKAYIKEKYNKPGNVYVGLVHRLDRPTGGVMVFAKTSKSAARLGAQIQDGTMEKEYMCVVCAIPREKQGNLVHYIKKDEKNNVVEIVPQSTEGAKRAELTYKVLETSGHYALLSVKIFTGRSHQIRVQLKSIGCPIYGDVKYGGEHAPKANLNLFATELKFNHPVSHERMVFRVYPPENEPAWKLFNVDKFLRVSTVNN